jgi:Domain of unknown function (DUF4160)
MPTVAMVDGVAIRFYPDEHPPPHFHAVFAEFVAQIRITPPEVLRGSLPPAKLARTVKVRSVEPVLFGVVKIVWLDGFEAIVDLRPVIAVGELFAFLREAPERFGAVALDEFGHSIRWIDDEGGEVDFGSDALRRRAERQAAILRLAS